MVEYGQLVYPEFDVSKEFVVEPDGTLVEVATVAQSDGTNGHGHEFERLQT